MCQTFVWEKYWEFQTTSPLKPLGQCCSNFMRSLLGAGEWKIAKMAAVHWPRWSPCPYTVKTFKNHLLQNPGSLGAESLHKSLRREGPSKLLKWWLYIDVWPFYGEVEFASVCIYMQAPIHLYGKNVDNFKQPPLKPLGQCCSNFMWSPLGVGERKIANMLLIHWPRWPPCPHFGKNL